MSRILLTLALAALVAAPGLASAQSCNPQSPTACTGGTVCKDISGTGQYFCSDPGVIPVQVTQSGNSGGPTESGNSGGPTESGTSGGPTESGTSDAIPNGIVNPIRVDSLQELLQIILEAVVQIGTIVLTLALVYVGFLFVVAQGNEEKLTNAKNALLWTIIGGLILLGASAIGAVIGSTVESFKA